VLTIIMDLPDGVFGAEASGEVSADDYRRVLVPAIEAELASGGSRLHFLLHLGPEFEGMKPDAMWQDAELRGRHIRAFEKVALVTDVDWITRSVHALAWLMPGDVRRFGNERYDEAVSWLAH
jgi:hypothetical protein